MPTTTIIEQCKNCSLNDSNRQHLFTISQFVEQDKIDLSSRLNHIVFLIEGAIKVYCDNDEFVCKSNQMMLLKFNQKYDIIALEKGKMLILNFTTLYRTCINIDSDKIEDELRVIKYRFCMLEMDHHVHHFVESVTSYLNQGICCNYLHDAKTMELFILYKFFYSTKELIDFFYPILYQNIVFDTLVRKNFEKSKTVKCLAELCGYSLSNFKKIFLKHFGISPYQWMQHQKISKLKARLSDKSIPIKSIALEFGFVDQSHLNAFCKRYLKTTPYQIRNNSGII